MASPLHGRRCQSVILSASISVMHGFQSLDGSARELYISFVLKLFASYGYFALSQILVIYLHNEFNASDVEAGAIYGSWGLCITIWGLLTAYINDRLGVRRSLLIGFGISTLASIVLAVARSKETVYWTLFIPLSLGNCMGIPMLTVGIKRLTTPVNRGFAFGLLYTVMNVAAFISGPIVDLSNYLIAFERTHVITGNRVVVLSTAVVYFLSFITTVCFVRDITPRGVPGDDASTIEMGRMQSPSTAAAESEEKGSQSFDAQRDDDVKVNPIIENSQGSDTIRAAAHTVSKPQPYAVLSDHDDDLESANASNSSIMLSSPSSPVGLPESNTSFSAPPNTSPAIAVGTAFVKEIVFSKTFWRFCLLSLFLINLRAVFRHLDATLPTYLVRSFGANYPKGIIYAINPFIIILLTPVIAAVTSKWPHFAMIKYGGFVSAASPFFLAISTSTWAAVMFVVMLSFGEAVWSPRLYDYTMSIAPEGKEATFSALASAPLFAAKIPVGLLSGYLLSVYLPDRTSEGRSSYNDAGGRTMWLIIGLLTISSPVCIAVFEKWIREPESNTAVTAAAEQSRHTPVAPRPAASSSSLSPLHQLKQRRKYEALQTSRDSDDDVPVDGDAGPGRSES